MSRDKTPFVKACWAAKSAMKWATDVLSKNCRYECISNQEMGGVVLRSGEILPFTTQEKAT